MICYRTTALYRVEVEALIKLYVACMHIGPTSTLVQHTPICTCSCVSN